MNCVFTRSPISITSAWLMRLIENSGGHIRDARNSEDANSHVARDDRFGDGGHADQIGANGPEITNFRGRFVTRAGKRGVNAFVQVRCRGASLR